MFSQSLRSLTRCSAASLRRLPTAACSSRRLVPVSSAPHNVVHRRTFATPPPQVNESHLTTEEYHYLADETMDELVEALEELLDAESDAGYEVDYHSGVLTLKLGPHGTYVINKQPPNKQIWLSSPLSGPKRYDYDSAHSQWVYARDGHTFDGLLTKELSDIFKKQVKLQDS